MFKNVKSVSSMKKTEQSAQNSRLI